MLYESDLILADPRDRKQYFIETTTTRKAVVLLLRVLFPMIGRLEGQGIENLPPAGPVMLAANHQTNFDVFPMQLVLPRPIFFMGKAELFQNPLLDALLRRLGSFPVIRGSRDVWALRQAARVLEQGQVLGIFPEGKRSRGRGLGKGKSGAARMALQSGCPIVPVAVTGTDAMFKYFPSRTPVTIRLGAPLYPHPHESPDELTDRIMISIAGLLPLEMRGVYADRSAVFDQDSLP